MLREAQRFWDAIAGKVKQVAQDVSKNAFRCERYEVTTAPNGSKIGVTLPLGTREIFLPYSTEVSGATVGSQVLVVWWGSMSNAKVYYYADGYRGCIFPIGYIYESTLPTSPAALFGGTWEQIKGRFLLATGTPDANTDNYFGAMSGTQWNAGAGSKGGQDYHTLTNAEMPSHTHTQNPWIIGAANGFAFHTSSVGVPYTTGSTPYFNINDLRTNGWADASNYNPDYAGGNGAHNNMPPYLAVYMWKRVA